MMKNLKTRMEPHGGADNTINILADMLKMDIEVSLNKEEDPIELLNLQGNIFIK